MNLRAIVTSTPHLIKAVKTMRDGKPIAMSFDIADFCNLACPYCYWLENTEGKQLKLDQIVKITREAVDRGIIHATWVGGEPTLRPDVLEAVTKIVPLNWVVTNGSRVSKKMAGSEYKNWDIEDLPSNAWPILSLDGVGNKHDASRNKAGLYDELVSRFFKTHRSHKTMTTTTLHQGNADQPAYLLEEWKNSGIVGMTFEFATPIGRKANPQLDIIGDDRNRAIDELIRLKKRYGSFLRNATTGLEMQRPENLASWVGPAKCPIVRSTLSFDSQGRAKSPCILGSNPANKTGKKPNCSACGCHVPTIIEGIKKFDIQTLQSVFWFLS